MTPRARWNAFWFAKGPSSGIGAFRCLFAVCLLMDVPNSLGRSGAAIAGGFHLPYLALIPPLSEPAYRLLHTLQYPLIGLILIGLFTRPAVLGLLLLQGRIFFADQLVFRNHSYFFLLVLVALLFSPAGEAFSLDSLRKGSRAGPRPLTWQRLIQVQVTLVYLFAALHKLHPAYLKGTVLMEVFASYSPFLGQAYPFQLRSLLADPRVMWAPALLSVFIELWLAYALWRPATRARAIKVGVVFHLAIAVSLRVYAFSAAMVAAYVLFIDPKNLNRPGRI